MQRNDIRRLRDLLDEYDQVSEVLSRLQSHFGRMSRVRVDLLLCDSQVSDRVTAKFPLRVENLRSTLTQRLGEIEVELRDFGLDVEEPSGMEGIERE